MKVKSELSSVLLDKGLAELGDCLLNFLVSAAKSRVLGRFCGERVPNKVLVLALDKSGLRYLLPKRLKPHARSNAVEALIAYAWLMRVITIDEAIDILASRLSIDAGTFNSYVDAVAELVRVIKGRIIGEA
mgnify:CR=1 FL=1